MATVILEVDIDAATAQAYLEYAGYRIRDAREPLTDTMHQVVWPAVRGQLDREGARSGQPWDELSTKYGKWKELHYPGRPILVLTGNMERALFADDSYRATRTSLVYSPESDYLHWHQEGGYILGRPPQRTVVELIVEDYEQIDNIFTSWLDELRTLNIRRPNDLGGAPGAPPISILGL